MRTKKTTTNNRQNDKSPMRRPTFIGDVGQQQKEIYWITKNKAFGDAHASGYPKKILESKSMN